MTTPLPTPLSVRSSVTASPVMQRTGTGIIGTGSANQSSRDLFQQQQQPQPPSLLAAYPYAYPPLLPPALHTCPGAGADDNDDGWESGVEDDDDDSDSDEGATSLLPPLIPPFRFALVECARPVAVGGPAPAAIAPPAGSTAGTMIKSSKSGAVSTSNSALSLTQLAANSQAPPAALAMPSLQHTASLPIRTRDERERRGSLAGAGGMTAAAASPAASPASTLSSLRQHSSNSSLASSSSSVSNIAGLAVMPVPSPPTSPSRGIMGSTASLGVPSSAPPAAAAAVPGSHTGRHVCLRGLADQSVYRGAYPTLKNFDFLARLRLKTIISLTPEQPTPDLRAFCRDGGRRHGHTEEETATTTDATSGTGAIPTRIQLYHFPVPKWNENVCVPPATAIAVVQLLSNAENLPAYVHCIDGGNNTALVIACMRKLQGWNMHSILAELLRFTRESSGVLDAERVFLDRFNHNGLLSSGGMGAGGTAGASGKDAIGGSSVAGGGGGGGGNTGPAVSATPSSSKGAGGAGSAGGSSNSSNPNILIRVPLLIPSWLWGGCHLAVHPSGLKLFDAHVPAIAAMHSKLLAPNDPALSGGGGGGSAGAGDNGLSSSTHADSQQQVYWRLLSEEELREARWDGRELQRSAEAEAEAEAERKRKKKAKKAAAAAAAAAGDVGSTSVAAEHNAAPSAGGGGGAGTEASMATSGAHSDGVDTASKADNNGGGHNDTRSVRSMSSASSPSEPGSGPAAAAASEKDGPGGARPLTPGSMSAAAAATAAAAASVSTSPPLPPISSPPLSHPGEFHPLLDLDKSHWGKTRSYLAADMLFQAGSFDLWTTEAPAGGNSNSTAASEEALLYGDASACVGGVCPSLEPRGVSSARAQLRECALQLCAEDQFLEHPDDPDERFTRDEFDSDVSLLLASLALEGFTMNHKITRPMQLFHTDQGEA